MGRERCVDGLMNAVNVFILLMIVLLYVVTGTGLGDDAVAALSSGTIYRGGGEGLVALECAVSWDAQALPDMLELLRERGVRLSGVNPLAKYGQPQRGAAFAHGRRRARDRHHGLHAHARRG